jgi:hypothetical protein
MKSRTPPAPASFGLVDVEFDEFDPATWLHEPDEVRHDVLEPGWGRSRRGRDAGARGRSPLRHSAGPGFGNVVLARRVMPAGSWEGKSLGFDVRADVGVAGCWDGGLQIAEPGAYCAD